MIKFDPLSNKKDKYKDNLLFQLLHFSFALVTLLSFLISSLILFLPSLYPTNRLQLFSNILFSFLNVLNRCIDAPTISLSLQILLFYSPTVILCKHSMPTHNFCFFLKNVHKCYPTTLL